MTKYIWCVFLLMGCGTIDQQSKTIIVNDGTQDIMFTHYHNQQVKQHVEYIDDVMYDIQTRETEMEISDDINLSIYRQVNIIFDIE